MTASNALFFVYAVEQIFFVATYLIMTVCVTHDAIHTPGNVSLACPADNRAFSRQAGRRLREPIMVLDHRLDPAIRRKMDSHFRKLGSRIAQERHVFLDRGFPKMEVEGFLTQISGSGRKVNYLRGTFDTPVIDGVRAIPARGGYFV